MKIIFIIEDLPGSRLTLYKTIANELLKKMEREHNTPDFIIHVIGMLPNNKVNAVIRTFNCNNEHNCIKYSSVTYEEGKANEPDLLNTISKHIKGILEKNNNPSYSVLLDLMLFNEADRKRIQSGKRVLSHYLYEKFNIRCGLYSVQSALNDWAQINNIPITNLRSKFWHIIVGLNASNVNFVEQAGKMGDKMYALAKPVLP
jgi:hypothetical protein